MSLRANSKAASVVSEANLRCKAKARVHLLPLWILVLAAVVFQTSVLGTAEAQSGVDEYHVKAAFLFHFAQLVEWPSDTPGDGGNSLVVCMLGEDPFHGELDNTVAGRQIGSRTLRIRRVNPSQAHGCNILFIGKSEDKRLAVLLASLRNNPVLTVGEADGFLTAGGMIRFCLEGKKVRFEINRDAAESARLKISSQLLLLARNVVAGKGGG